MKKTVLSEGAGSTWSVVARDSDRPSHLIDTNEYLVFAGDVGLLTDPGGQEIFPAVFSAVNDVCDPRRITHIFAMAEGLHRRWMGSRAARDAWCERVSRLDIGMLCPQHSAIYRGADVGRFIDWFSRLPGGVLRTALADHDQVRGRGPTRTIRERMPPVRVSASA